MSDSEDLGGVYRRCGPAIYRRALKLLQDAQEALDVMQDTFLQYMQSQRSWRGKASTFTLLYEIVTCKAVDRLRRRARWSGILGPLEVRDTEDSDRSAEEPPSPSRSMEQMEALSDLAVLTRDEPPEVILAAVLHFVDRLPLTDVARELGLDRKKVRKMLDQFTRRALQRSAQFKPRAQS